MTQSERERLAALETKVDTLVEQQAAHDRLLREVRDAIVAARGARWALASLVTVAGVIGGLVGQFFPR